MCKAPNPPKPKAPEKPEFLRNRYLDSSVGQSATVMALRTGRSSLRIPLSGRSTGGLNYVGRTPGTELQPPNTQTRAPGNPPPTAADIAIDQRRHLRGRLVDALTGKIGHRSS